MLLSQYYDEALLSQIAYRNDLQKYINNPNEEQEKSNKKFSIVKIPASNGNPAYEYRVIDVENNTQTGYYGVAFEKFVNGSSANEIVISHRGTNSFSDFTNANIHIATNGLFSFGQFDNALSFFYRVSSQLDDFINLKQVGHSLGGGLAKLVSAAADIDTVVFNAPQVKHLLDGVTKQGIWNHASIASNLHVDPYAINYFDDFGVDANSTNPLTIIGRILDGIATNQEVNSLSNFLGDNLNSNESLAFETITFFV